eukprot:TRINITY_DN13141_c0_g1_i1.p1 TRINITY_DN13141_c0_g1~~TRINITY_DN13141_c0_g1_i1.p1  ORF type:complete len:364 (+),score=62.69 TRINITY_DN13141_c0_g1_i1:27-1094(+)
MDLPWSLKGTLKLVQERVKAVWFVWNGCVWRELQADGWGHFLLFCREIRNFLFLTSTFLDRRGPNIRYFFHASYSFVFNRRETPFIMMLYRVAFLAALSLAVITCCAADNTTFPMNDIPFNNYSTQITAIVSYMGNQTKYQLGASIDSNSNSLYSRQVGENTTMYDLMVNTTSEATWMTVGSNSTAVGCAYTCDDGVPCDSGPGSYGGDGSYAGASYASYCASSTISPFVLLYNSTSNGTTCSVNGQDGIVWTKTMSNFTNAGPSLDMAATWCYSSDNTTPYSLDVNVMMMGSTIESMQAQFTSWKNGAPDSSLFIFPANCTCGDDDAAVSTHNASPSSLLELSHFASVMPAYEF